MKAAVSRKCAVSASSSKVVVSSKAAPMWMHALGNRLGRSLVCRVTIAVDAGGVLLQRASLSPLSSVAESVSAMDCESDMPATSAIVVSAPVRADSAEAAAARRCRLGAGASSIAGKLRIFMIDKLMV